MRGPRHRRRHRRVSGGVHICMEHANRGKRSLGLDLTEPEGVDIALPAGGDSDVFLTNKLPRVPEAQDRRRRHPGPQPEHHLRARHGLRQPRPRRRRRRLRLARLLGAFRRRGRRSRPPSSTTADQQPAPAFGDSIGAMTIAGGISAALLHRERTGEAKVVDVSLLATGDVGHGRRHRGVAGHRA